MLDFIGFFQKDFEKSRRKLAFFKIFHAKDCVILENTHYHHLTCIYIFCSIFILVSSNWQVLLHSPWLLIYSEQYIDTERTTFTWYLTFSFRSGWFWGAFHCQEQVPWKTNWESKSKTASSVPMWNPFALACYSLCLLFDIWF